MRLMDREGSTCLVAVDRGIATVGGVAIIFGSTAILHSVSLPPLQSDTYNQKFTAGNGGRHMMMGLC